MEYMKRIAPLKIKAIVLAFGITLAACSTSGKAPSGITNPDLVAEVEVTAAVNQPGAPLATVTAEPTSKLKETATPPPNITLATNNILPEPVDLRSFQDDLERLYEEASPGVVSIRVLSLDGQTLGSGFVYDKSGHIVTNYHVVRTESDVEVTFSTGDKTNARIIGVDPDSDLAVLKVDIPFQELVPLPLGDSDEVKVGQFAAAIGNPFGLEGAMTFGIVSGTGRILRSLSSAYRRSSTSVVETIQTDAAINPGNSGGPLLNMDGEVIGVNESIATSGADRHYIGVSFAISINFVKRIASALIQEGEFIYPYLGISSVDELSIFEQEALGLSRSSGVYITDVMPDGPADQAGLQAGTQETDVHGVLAGGDLIYAIDGHPVKDFNELINYLIKNMSPGDEVELTVLRGDQVIKFVVTLGRRPIEEVEER
jgi:S1-C subfamily serine protease